MRHDPNGQILLAVGQDLACEILRAEQTWCITGNAFYFLFGSLPWMSSGVAFERVRMYKRQKFAVAQL